MTKDSMPGAHEIMYHGALGYSPSELPFDRIAYIWPTKNHITLGFFFGMDLPDPQNLLTGEGARMRYVKIETIKEAENPALQTLIKAAWTDAPDALAKLHRK